MDLRRTVVFFTALYWSAAAGMLCVVCKFWMHKICSVWWMYITVCNWLYYSIIIPAGTYTMIDCLNNVTASKSMLKFSFTQLLLYSSTLPVATWPLHPIYTLFRGPEEGMVGMECQVEMAGMEDKERKEILVWWDHLVHEVCMLTYLNVSTNCQWILRVTKLATISACNEVCCPLIFCLDTAVDYSIA